MNFKSFLLICLVCVNIQVYAQDNSNMSRPDGGVYFIKRNTTISEAQYKLISSLRPIDKKDIGDTTVTIQSYGEGWLDKDSIPVGKWQFFAADNSGKEYLLKTGVYIKTSPQMFKFRDEDSVAIDTYSLWNVDSLKNQFCRSYAFIKTGKWYYYHPDGKIWKQALFLSSELSFEFNLFYDEKDNRDHSTIIKIMIVEKPENDEWLNTVEEYNPGGWLFKKLEFFQNGFVSYKVIFDRKGNKIKVYGNILEPINPNNY